MLSQAFTLLRQAIQFGWRSESQPSTTALAPARPPRMGRARWIVSAAAWVRGSTTGWSIGRRLAAMVIAVVLPLAVIIAAVIWDLAQAAREAKHTSLQYTARSVAAAVDALLERDVALARALARSPALDALDLTAFRAEAQRALAGISDKSIVLADVAGQQLMNTRIPAGAPLPRRDPAALAAQRRAFAEGRFVVSDVFIGQEVSRWVATIELPLQREGQPPLALAVSIDLDGFLKLLNAQHVPPGWRTSVVDRQGVFVARVPDDHRLSGHPVSPTWQRVMGKEGVFDILSADGEPLVAGTALTSVGWTTGIAVLRSELNAEVLEAIQWVTAAGAVVILLSVLLAWRIARSISQPVLALGRLGPEMLGGQWTTVPAMLPEVQTVASLLRESADHLRGANEQLRLAFEAAEGGAWQLDPATGEITASSRALELYGLTADQPLTIACVLAAVHPHDRGRLDAAMGETLATGRPFRVEFRVCCVGGRVRWSISSGARYSGLHGTRVIGLVQDITTRKESEAVLAHAKEDLERRVAERTSALEREMASRVEAQAALAQARRLDALGRLASGVAHDTNNGLAAITTYVELAEARTGDPQVRAALTGALNAIEVTASLNRRFLGLAHGRKASAGALQVKEYLAGMVGMLQRMLGVNVVLETRLPEGLWPITIDAGEFDSALLNLVINSRDAMPKGGRLMIEARNATLGADEITRAGDAAPGGYVCIAVRDEGSGMPPEVLARAADAFFTTKGASEGTGLGLSNVREVTRNAGGFVTIESQPGEGTTVSLYLPRARPAERGPAGALPNERDAVPMGDGELVLLVEDHPDLLKSTYLMLEGLGYSVIAAGDGPQALALLERGEPVDLLLSDVVLPGGMTGFDIAQQVLARWPNVRIALASGFYRGDASDAQQGLQILRKPYRRRELARALTAAARGAQVT